MPNFIQEAHRRITRSRKKSRGLLRHRNALAIIPDMKKEPYSWEIKETEWYVLEAYYEWNSAKGMYELVDQQKVVLNVVAGAIGAYDGAKYNAEKAKDTSLHDPEKPYMIVSRPKYNAEYDYSRPTKWRVIEILPEKKFKNDIEVED